MVFEYMRYCLAPPSCAACDMTEFAHGSLSLHQLQQTQSARAQPQNAAVEGSQG